MALERIKDVLHIERKQILLGKDLEFKDVVVVENNFMSGLATIVTQKSSLTKLRIYYASSRNS